MGFMIIGQCSWKISSDRKSLWARHIRYFLTAKSEALGAFRSFQIHVEKETSHAIKGLRTDRGGEFTSNEFMQHCADLGIQHQLTATYSRQQNGIAERKN